MNYFIRTIGAAVLALFLIYAPFSAVLASAATPKFAITRISSYCSGGVPHVSVSWSSETGADEYLLERKFPQSTEWEVTGATTGLTLTDSTWLPGYAPGVYS